MEDTKKIFISKEELEKILDRIHEWIRSADQKVSIFLALQGIFMPLAVPSLFNFVKNNMFEMSELSFLFFILAIIVFAYSFIKSASALIPRLNSGKKENSLLYFGDIAELKLKDYKKRLSELSDTEYNDELIRQIHISSIIANKKHTHFKDSVILFVISVLFLISAYFFWIIPKCYGN